MTRRFFTLILQIGKTASLLAVCLLAVGCEITIEQPAAPTASGPHEVQVPPAQAAVVGKAVEIEKQAIKDSKENRAKLRHPTRDEPNEILLAEAQTQPRPRERAGSPNPTAKSGVNPARAFQEIRAEVRDSLELRKTLVVWLVEQTAQSSALANDAAEQISRTMLAANGAKLKHLEMAIIGYGDDADLITPEPLSDVNLLHNAAATLKEKKGDQAKVFAAFNMAIDKFLPFRNRGYEVLLVVVGTSAGDDLASADDAIGALKNAEVPVYGIGPAAPFIPYVSRANLGRSRRGATIPEGKLPIESLAPERIALALSGNESAADLNDAGYGPFGLERICRLTEGMFFRLHSARPAGWDDDPNTGDVKSDLLDRYVPDYVNQQQYEQLLAENKCRMALHNAAQLPPTEGLESVTTDFPKQKDEAAMAQKITIAQRAAADRDQPMQKLYDTMTAGEADRSKLTGPRWQAAYDLAMGQVLAAKARLDGYNAMLAILKQGKAFTNPASQRWVLEPADEIAASSVMDKMAKNSRIFLQRVVKEHPGTPWAAIAQHELRHPAGWKLVEK